MTTATDVTLAASAAHGTVARAMCDDRPPLMAGRVAGMTDEGDARVGCNGLTSLDSVGDMRTKTVDEILRECGVRQGRIYRMIARPVSKKGNDIIFEHERAVLVGSYLTSTSGIKYRVIRARRTRETCLVTGGASMWRTAS